ncbi:MAG: M20/M25/M40 family metallo-hydrolase [Gammaproteobacteria bacterium]|nr:M20/M25/M40 family metallo-hydrolase [Gammaproteobacteria bacterium]
MNRCARLVLALLLQAVVASFAQAALNSDETRIAAAVDAGQAEALALLETVVNINSGTMNFAGVRKVGQVFEEQFTGMGFETRWVEGAAFNRAGHLLASYGTGGPKVLMIGHLDTVFAADSPFQRYEPLEGNRVRGPGITDMKGGDVVIVSALKAMKAAGALDQLSVRVVLMGDEENRGEPYEIANAVLIDAARWADVAIGFEDGDGNPETIVVARRGSTSWQLKVTGTPSHSSQIFQPEIGYGAIYEAARILDGFRTALSNEPNLTFSPGVIVGGTDTALDADTSAGTAFGKENVVARSVLVNGDIRALSPEQLIAAKAVMQDIVAGHLGGTHATIEFSDGYPPLAPSEGNYMLMTLYGEGSEDLGFGPVEAVDPRKAGAADVSFTSGLVRQAIDGAGLMGSGGHTEDEIADMSTLPEQGKRMAVLLYRLANPPR